MSIAEILEAANRIRAGVAIGALPEARDARSSLIYSWLNELCCAEIPTDPLRIMAWATMVCSQAIVLRDVATIDLSEPLAPLLAAPGEVGTVP